MYLRELVSLSNPGFDPVMSIFQTTSKSFLLPLVPTVVFAVCSHARANTIDYQRQILPILKDHCYKCHGPETQEAGIRFDQRPSMLRGGDSGKPAIVPGVPGESNLVRVLAPHFEPRMPPEGPALTTAQIRLLETWILDGANWPGQMHLKASDITSNLWSLQPLNEPAVPQGATSNPIDAFIDAKLRAADLRRSAPAAPVTQLRRLHLVLTGLPPTLQDLQRFNHHPEGIDMAYAESVNQLLDSPRYGERWAQHWLDVIRWAETVGFETNLERPNAWPYRDWVIQSLNADKPYDQFVFEQIAGDTIGEDAALGFLVAGPANLPGQVGRDENAMRQARQDELDEVIRTVSQGFMGLTIGCARCHNHKFDPILQRDYYAMQGIFAGLSYGERRLRGAKNDTWQSQLPKAKDKLQQHLKRHEDLKKELGLEASVENIQREDFPPVTAQSVRMTITATQNGSPPSLYEFEVWSSPDTNNGQKNVALASHGSIPTASSFALANQTRHFDNLTDGTVDRRQAFPWVAAQSGPAWIGIDLVEPTEITHIVFHRGNSTPVEYTLEYRESSDAEWQLLSDATRKMPREDDLRTAETLNLADVSAAKKREIAENSTSIRKARSEVNRLASGPRVFAASFMEKPEATWQLGRGDPMQRTRQIKPGIPKVLGELRLDDAHPESERRIALAKDLTRNDHPLTARVIVNRVWQHHFGHGLTDTPSDLGSMGSRPTHPDLLDWLAFNFIKDGWSLKSLHRRIVMSDTFRQDNLPDAKALAVDADARLLWRFPPRRMEAEAIRDSILQTSGKLNLAGGGRGFSLFKQRGGLSGYDPIEEFDQSGWRRMIYAHKIRMQSVDIFGSFDCPDAGQMRPKRTQSITPMQALNLFNSTFATRQAGFFAQRIEAMSDDTAASQTEMAFLLALSRKPTTIEHTAMEELVKEQGLIQLCRILMNTSEFLYIP